jgi:hypothetical protein
MSRILRALKGKERLVIAFWGYCVCRHAGGWSSYVLGRSTISDIASSFGCRLLFRWGLPRILGRGQARSVSAESFSRPHKL